MKLFHNEDIYLINCNTVMKYENVQLQEIIHEVK